MKRFCLVLLTGSALALTGLTSCASQMPEASLSQATSADAEIGAAPLETAIEAKSDRSSAQQVAQADKTAEQITPAERPQLIKRANLVLSVDSVEKGFEQVREIVATQQGDVLSLNDTGERQRRITFSLRVPQDRLDATLDALTAIGTVRSRAITTEDVSSQLVDLQARLSNARKSEEALQEIMSRSGEISDVLEVSRELGNVRQNIEQMAAQQKNLQTQVRYSTINLTLESAIALSPKQPAVSNQLKTSWKAATQSVGEFTTDLLQLGLWLLAYSPYLAVLLCGAVVARRVRRSRAS
ncbi:MAG: DUF4349 domain-containing protein [Cyanobacteria bacterium J06597_16]